MSRFKRGGRLGPPQGNFGCVFEEQLATDDLSYHVIKQARKSGTLSLANRGLVHVPDKVWRINELDAKELKKLDVSLESDDRWWEQEDLTRLNLSSNQIEEISDNIEHLTALQVFDAHDNKIVSLSDKIGELAFLTRIDLSRNLLTSLPSTLCSLAQLKSLQVQHCQLDCLPGQIDNLSSLEYLDISNNNLTELPPSLGFMSSVRKFNASANKITELPHEIGGMRCLEQLDVNQNKLETLPSSIGELRKLEQLYATQNRITSLPVPTQPTNLKELHLTNNLIVELSPEFIETILRIKILHLGDNKIKELPANITLLQELERFEVINNHLLDLPPELGLLPHLKALLLEGNAIRSIRRDIIARGTQDLLKYLRSRITDDNIINAELAKEKIVMPSDVGENIPDIYAMRSSNSLNLSEKIIIGIPEGTFETAKEADINIVDLSKNRLTAVPQKLEIIADQITELNLEINFLSSLPSFIGSCKRLTYINLARNKLTTLPEELGSLTRLREVCLSANNLTKVPSCLFHVNSLEILIMNDNHITNIDAGDFSKLSNLATLDLHNNDLVAVPPELGNMTQLKLLKLDGNSFRNPRRAILEKGTDALLAYLRDRIPE